MKTNILFSLLAIALSMAVVEARTWTSADGSKTFSGDFKSYNEVTGEVIVMRGYRKAVFKESMLSEADIKWLKGQPSKAAAEEVAESEKAGEALAAQVIGSKLQKGVLVKSNGRRFARYELESAPEYYILYFSASWWGPCRSAAPQLVKSYNDKIAPKKNLEFILYSLDRSDDSALDWAKKEKFPWAHILSNKHSKSGLSKYKKNFVPYFVMIDAEGKILAEGKSGVFAKAEELGK